MLSSYLVIIPFFCNSVLLVTERSETKTKQYTPVASFVFCCQLHLAICDQNQKHRWNPTDKKTKPWIRGEKGKFNQDEGVILNLSIRKCCILKLRLRGYLFLNSDLVAHILHLLPCCFSLPHKSEAIPALTDYCDVKQESSFSLHFATIMFSRLLLKNTVIAEQHYSKLVLNHASKDPESQLFECSSSKYLYKPE